MTFISYAQNFEDVMLWRALKHVEKGFYIDVGAWSPDLDSVTKAFYERGWRGINIEPDSEMYTLLNTERREDTNLCVALADFIGRHDFHRLSNTGLSTLDKEISAKFEARGMSVQVFPVDVLTLNAVWKKHVGSREVHFLKIDAEGFEERIIKGNDWRKNRPWIVVIEATWPMSQVESHGFWESVLLEANYLFAYADGTNRFYVALEKSELLDCFKYPPNFFDNFKRSDLNIVEKNLGELMSEKKRLISHFKELELEKSAMGEVLEEKKLNLEASFQKIQELEAELNVRVSENRKLEALATELRTKEEHLSAEVHQWFTESKDLNVLVNAIHASWSWRFTAPARWLAGLVIAGFKISKHHSVHVIEVGIRAVQGPLAWLIRFLISHPNLSSRLNRRLLNYPWLYERLLGVARRTGLLSGYSLGNVAKKPDWATTTVLALANLTPRARRIYNDLNAEIEQRRKDRG